MRIRKPSAGVVLGTTALVVALAGTGPAADAAKLINGKLIKTGTVTGKQIKDGSISARDLAPGIAVAGLPGPTGATGAQGAPGMPGTNGVSGLQKVSAEVDVAAHDTHPTTLSCPTPKKVLSATAWWSGSNNAVQVTLSYNNTTQPSAATAYFDRTGDGAGDTGIFVILCATAL